MSEIGNKYGRLTVVSLPPHKPYEPQLAVCDCECGGSKTAALASIKYGNTLSCGCLRKEVAAARQLKHGDSAGGSRTLEYQIWKGMRQRCRNKKNKAYKNYGGRGIKVCSRWDSFSNFISDMGRKPTKAHTIERKNNNGDYCPSNCVWATRSDNCNNKRNCRIVTYKGRSMTMSQWAKKLNLNETSFRDRFSYGWTTDRIFSPKNKTPNTP